MKTTSAELFIDLICQQAYEIESHNKQEKESIDRWNQLKQLLGNGSVDWIDLLASVPMLCNVLKLRIRLRFENLTPEGSRGKNYFKLVSHVEQKTVEGLNLLIGELYEWKKSSSNDLLLTYAIA